MLARLAIPGHHRAHIEMDIIQSIHNATDIKNIPQPGLPRGTGFQIQNRQGGAAGAHVNPIAS